MRNWLVPSHSTQPSSCFLFAKAKQPDEPLVNKEHVSLTELDTQQHESRNKSLICRFRYYKSSPVNTTEDFFLTSRPPFRKAIYNFSQWGQFSVYLLPDCISISMSPKAIWVKIPVHWVWLFYYYRGCRRCVSSWNPMIWTELLLNSLVIDAFTVTWLPSTYHYDLYSPVQDIKILQLCLDKNHDQDFFFPLTKIIKLNSRILPSCMLSIWALCDCAWV